MVEEPDEEEYRSWYMDVGVYSVDPVEKERSTEEECLDFQLVEEA